MALGSRCQREERAQGHMSASGTSPETPPPRPLLLVWCPRWRSSNESPTGTQRPLLLGRRVLVGGALVLEIDVVKATVTSWQRARPSFLQRERPRRREVRT